MGMRRMAGGGRFGLRRQNGGHGEDAGQRRHRILARFAQRFGSSPARGRHLQREADIAVANDHALYQSALDHTFACDRIEDPAECVEYVVPRNSHVVCLRPLRTEPISTAYALEQSKRK
jgi:hypothetical protein